MALPRSARTPIALPSPVVSTPTLSTATVEFAPKIPLAFIPRLVTVPCDKLTVAPALARRACAVAFDADIVVFVAFNVEPVPSICAPIEAPLPAAMLAVSTVTAPPAETSSAMERVPFTWNEPPLTIAVEPAPCTDRPCPNCPAAVMTLFPCMRTLLPDMTRTPAAGLIVVPEPRVLIDTSVNDTAAPFSMRTPAALVPLAVLTAGSPVTMETPVASMRLGTTVAPATAVPLAHSPWLPMAEPPEVMVPVVVIDVPGPMVAVAPASTRTPNEPRPAVLTVPPVNAIELPGPEA
ncbi:hypothetical protein ACAE110713_26935 [Achromobacter aegrifaciens]